MRKRWRTAEPDTMMNIIAEKKSKSDKYDVLRCVRADGTQTTTSMPRQGVLPHDLIHYVVETTLGYEYGFLGLIARGAEIGFAMAQTHDLHNAALADQAIHAEALVESLQAQIWSGAFDHAQFLAGLEGACAMRGRGMPDLSMIDAGHDLYATVMDLGERWRQVPFFGALALEFGVDR
jgi:hypothetical protein